MNIAVHSILAPSLPIGINQNQVAAELGEPQSFGQGMGGAKLIVYRDQTIQLTFLANRLSLLAFYFRTDPEQTKWPHGLEALEAFSKATHPGEVEEWLQRHGIQYRCTSGCGNEVIEATGGNFYFESGRLDSIQITS